MKNLFFKAQHVQMNFSDDSFGVPIEIHDYFKSLKNWPKQARDALVLLLLEGIDGLHRKLA